MSNGWDQAAGGEEAQEVVFGLREIQHHHRPINQLFEAGAVLLSQGVVG